MSEAEMAERIDVSRTTLRKLEHGDLTVTTAILARALEVLGFEQDLDLLAADDEIGHRLADARTPLPHSRNKRPVMTARDVVEAVRAGNERPRTSISRCLGAGPSNPG